MGKIGSTSLLMTMMNVFKYPEKANNEKWSSKRREDQEHDYSEEKKKRKRRWIFQQQLPYERTIHHHVTRSITLAEYLVNVPSSDAVKCQPESAIEFDEVSTIAAEQSTATAAVTKQHAATVIQTIFRSYLARRALGGLKGIVKLQALIRGQNVRMQANMTLRSMQALIRVQNLVCGQRKSVLSESPSSSSNCKRVSDATARRYICENWRDLEDANGDEEHLAKKIHELLRRTKEATSRCESYLAHAFSQQMWSPCKDQISAADEKYKQNVGYLRWKSNKQRAQIIRTSYDEKEDIKIVEIDTIQSCTYSSPLKKAHHGSSARSPSSLKKAHHGSSTRSPSSLKKAHHGSSTRSPTKKIALKIQMDKVHSGSEDLPQEMRSSSDAQTPTTGLKLSHGVKGTENGVPRTQAQPKYLEATVSASARAQSRREPRHRPLTPERERNVPLKKLPTSPAHLLQLTPRVAKWL